ncbi:hypothetical protein HDU76_010813 [Blyttiomyces sp. JEL0837]|nr:hypothetical protein HDU76_010813 [Blyttiomyces sp. JEL0837]
MGKPYAVKVKMMAHAVGNNLPLASPSRLGHLPHEMKPFRGIIPTFMHGRKITFTDMISEKGDNRTRKPVFPNVIYRYCYSRLLDMNIYARITTTTLREIEQRGGFDEYILTIGEKKCDNDAARMYKRLIDEAYAKKKDIVQKEEEALVAPIYGNSYAK